MINMSETHPVTIYLLLTNKLGPQWLQYDMMIIDTIIKREFGIDEISEPTLNKILSIMTANQSDSVYVNAFAFEKSALGLCSKPLEMLKEQQEQLNMQDIVFTIDVLDRVTPYDDVYDNFGKEIMNFISDVLASKEIYIYSPTKIVSSPLEPAFNASLNEYLLKLHQYFYLHLVLVMMLMFILNGLILSIFQKILQAQFLFNIML